MLVSIEKPAVDATVTATSTVVPGETPLRGGGGGMP